MLFINRPAAYLDGENHEVTVPMPTVLRSGSYRFYFYSNENSEPAHIHVQKGNALAKFWLNPVTLASQSGFPAHELNKLNRLTRQNAALFYEAWNEFFRSTN